MAEKIAAELFAAISSKGRASLCVPGGTTLGPVFDRLSGISDVNWSKVSVFLNDERWVDEASPRSNTRLLCERLLTGAVASVTLVPLYVLAPCPEDQLEYLSRGLIPHLPVDVLLLGMGTDMHTASLFPSADRLDEALAEDAPTLMVLRADAVAEPRITLTAPALRAARRIHILIKGAEKQAALERALTLSPKEAPVQVVLPHAVVHWAA